MPKVFVLIACYGRANYLGFHLDSLRLTDDCEIVILNDDNSEETDAVVDGYRSRGFPIRAIRTRSTADNGVWRVPGFAFNIGLRQCDSDIIVLTCAEMYHLGDSLRCVVAAVQKDNMALATPKTLYDDNGRMLALLQEGNHSPTGQQHALESIADDNKQRYLGQHPFLANHFMPYFMGISRRKLIDIGGYDEDFTGVGCEDNDLVDRLVASGCHYEFVPTSVVHLHHDRPKAKSMFTNPRYMHNLKLYKDRKGVVVRNIGREWGVL